MSINTLPDLAGQNQSFDSSDAFLQRIDSLLSLVSQASFPSQPDQSTYVYDGDIKTGQPRREGYLRILNWIRETDVYNYSKLPPKMRQALSNIEADLQARGLLKDREKEV